MLSNTSDFGLILSICYIYNFVEDQPYWMNLPKVLTEIFTEFKKVMSTVIPDLLKWAREKVTTNDPVKKLTGGALDTVSQPNAG